MLCKGSKTDLGFYNYQSPKGNTSEFGNQGLFSNSGADEMAFTSGFNETQEMKKSSRRIKDEG